MTKRSSFSKRVLLIGGLASSLINFRWPLITSLANRGYKVFGCAAENEKTVQEKFQEIGGDYFSIPLSRAGLNPIQDFYAYLALRNLMRSLHPDIVIAYTIKPIVYGIPAARAAGVTQNYALVTGVGYAFTSTDGSWKRRVARAAATYLYRRALAQAKHVFFQNPDDRALFINQGLLGSTPSSVVNGSGVEINHFTPAPLPKENNFLLIARLVADKGIREYVEAAKLTKKKYPDTRFYLAGPIDPNPSAISETELRSWQQEGYITYLGSLSDVRPAIANTRVYVLPSYREGTPRTVLEAMAMGRPIVTTDTPGCRETVKNGQNGILVPPMDPEALADAFAQLVQNPQMAHEFGKNSRKLAVQKYDSRLVANQIVDVIISHTYETSCAGDTNSLSN